MAYTVQQCREMLDLLRETEIKILKGGKAYSIDNRRLDRADLADIRLEIDKWEKRYTKAQAATNGRHRKRTIRIMPRDL